MTNDIFSSRRFCLFIKQYAGENKKRFLQMTLGILGILIFCTSILPVITGCYLHPSYSGIDVMWNKEESMFSFLLFLIVIISAASTFSSYDSKIKRISALTLPASPLEKFATYILFNVVAIYIVFFAGILIADQIRVWTAPIYANPGAVIKPIPLSYLFSFGYIDGDTDISTFINDESMQAITMFTITGLLGLQAFFTLCSAIWPKRGKLSGFVSLVGISIAFNTILFFSFRLVLNMYGTSFRFRWEEQFREMDMQTFMTVCCTISTLVIIGLYTLSYKRFKEMESIERW